MERICPYCKRYVPSEYDFDEHKELCKDINKDMRDWI